MAISLVPLLGVMALVLDAGLLMSERRRTQAAADAAAWAAACAHQEAIAAGQDPQAAALSAAYDYAAANGFQNAGGAVTVGPVTDQTSRFYNRTGCYQVTVVSRTPRLFSSIWSSEPIPVSARSISYLKSSAPPAIVALNAKDQYSLSVVGSARLIAQDDPNDPNDDREIQVKSNHAKSSTINNMGYVEGPALRAGGGVELINAQVSKLRSIRSGSDPSAIKDPQESLPRPTTSGLLTRQSPSGWNATNPYPIEPGVYPSGLKLNSGGMNYTLKPGTYYIQNGDFEVSNGVRATGSDVLIYLDNGNINIQGGEGTNLSPPSSGTYAGISIFQRSDKNPVTGDYTPRTISIANGTNNKINGVIYAPGATAAFAGGSSNKYGSQLIVNKLNLSNNAIVTIPKWSGTVSYTPYLAE